VKSSQYVKITTHFHPVWMLRMNIAISSFPPDALMAYSGNSYFNLPNKYVMKAI